MPQHLVTQTLQILILMRTMTEDLNLLVQELGEHSDEESMGIV